MATLEEIRAKLLAENQKTSSGSGGGANEIYPFWNIPEGSTATVRFLPDGDADNTLFWVERLIIKLPFDGIKGGDDKKVLVQVPCVEMWDKPCPVLTEVRPWFKDPELEQLGRTYWKKRSYVFQGFVVNDPMDEEDVPENPIRRFVINKSIYEIIRSSLMDSEMEEIPTDYTAGRDFKLTKTKRGQYADYSTSSWSMRTRALSDEEMAAIDTYNLFDLKEYLPKEPADKTIEVIKEMFHASVNGEPYDESRWGNYYRPAGMQRVENKTTITPPSNSSASKEVEKTSEEVPFETDTPAPKPNEALAKLKARASELETDEAASDDSPSEEAGEGKPDPKQILDMIKKRSQSKS